VVDQRVAVVVNPTKQADLAGSRSRLDLAVTQLGFSPPQWHLTTPDDHGAVTARRLADEGFGLVLVWGGDGTVKSVARGLLHTPTAIGLLPAGTGNLLARNLDVPLHLAAAVRAAYLGRDRVIDTLAVSLGRGDVRTSLVMTGTGWDAAMMDVGHQLKRRLGWGAYAVEGVRRLREHPLRLRISVDGGEPQRMYGRSCIVANVGTLVAGLQLLPEAEPDDGLLDVLVLDPTNPLDYARTSWTVIRGQGTEADPARTWLRGREVIITTHASRERQIDGDPVEPGHGFAVRVRPRSLTVRVPVSESAQVR
jgi:diacylglycerol kinase family enzyme